VAKAAKIEEDLDLERVTKRIATIEKRILRFN
jgi:hypothetical protein